MSVKEGLRNHCSRKMLNSEKQSLSRDPIEGVFKLLPRILVHLPLLSLLKHNLTIRELYSNAKVNMDINKR